MKREKSKIIDIVCGRIFIKRSTLYWAVLISAVDSCRVYFRLIVRSRLNRWSLESRLDPIALSEDFTRAYRIGSRTHWKSQLQDYPRLSRHWLLSKLSSLQLGLCTKQEITKMFRAAISFGFVTKNQQWFCPQAKSFVNKVAKGNRKVIEKSAGFPRVYIAPVWESFALASTCCMGRWRMGKKKKLIKIWKVSRWDGKGEAFRCFVFD